MKHIVILDHLSRFFPDWDKRVFRYERDQLQFPLMLITLKVWGWHIKQFDSVEQIEDLSGLIIDLEADPEFCAFFSEDVSKTWEIESALLQLTSSCLSDQAIKAWSEKIQEQDLTVEHILNSQTTI